MARRFVIECDGCGGEEAGDADGEAIAVEAALPLLGPRIYSVAVKSKVLSLDLCGRCKRQVCAAIPPAAPAPVCASCGSGNVRATAQVVWDAAARGWVKDPDGGGWESWCNDCGGGSSLKEEGSDG